MRRVGLLVLSALSALSVLSAEPARAQPSPPAHVATRSALAAALEAAAASDYAAAEKALLAIQGADRPAALLGVARIRFEQGRFVEADRLAQQSAASPDQRLAATALRGEILAAQGKVDDAIKLLAPSKDGAGVGGRRVRLVLGELLIRAGRRADAEPVLLKFADEYGSDAISSSRRRGTRDGGSRDAPPAASEGREPRLQRERARRGRHLGRAPARRDAPLARRSLLRHVRPGPRRRGARRGAQDRSASGRRGRPRSRA